MNSYRLSAWIAQEKVGILTYHDDSGRFSFDYDPGWLVSPNVFPICPSLALQRSELQTAELHSISVRRFFENLLPEGKILDDVAMTYSVSKANLFGLLRWLGKETSGALSLLPEDIIPEQIDNSKREVSFEELSERIANRNNQPFVVWDGKVRLSLAGYQDKLTVYIDGATKLYLVEGQLASTHILKPEPVYSKLDKLVANEHFCMRLAAAIGIATATVDILRVPDPVLLVTRFDRLQQHKKVKRLHIVDTCQVLNLSVSHKYERNFGSGRDVETIRDGVSFEKLFSIAKLTQSEAVTRMSLIRWVLLQYLIGNSDAHGKNISFMMEQSGLRLAPAYDIVSVCIYPEIDHELAMAVGDEFVITQIRAYDWADFSQRCDIDRRLLVREMTRTIKSVRQQLPVLLLWPGYTKDEYAILEKIKTFVLKQAAQLESDAKLVTSVDLS